jgi:hypothetical protein
MLFNDQSSIPFENWKFLLVYQRMVNAITCYYCSTAIHGNHCNNPFLLNNKTFTVKFNSSYKACAVSFSEW